MTKGNRIKIKREELGIGQTELAKKVGISKQSLYKYEKDIVTNIPSDVIERLSRALHTTPAYLMGWKDGEADILIEFDDYYKGLAHKTSKLIAYLDAFATLSPETQDKIIDYMDYQIKKENENAES